VEGYWFATQDPKVLECQPGGLWVLDRFRNSQANLNLSVGDWVAVYEPQHDRDKKRDDGSKAVVALARITELVNPWRQEGDFWRIAISELVYKDPKGVSASTVMKIITGDQTISGSVVGWYLNRRYAGRITPIGQDKFDAIAKYFSADDIDENYQEGVERTAASINPPQIPTEPQYEDLKGQKKLVTDHSLAKYCLVRSSFHCEIDHGHISFISKVTGSNFVEAHHLIPLKAQTDFNNALDNQANIFSLCPNCHRLLHHATESEKSKLLKILLSESRKEGLKQFGTPISFEKLLNYY